MSSTARFGSAHIACWASRSISVDLPRRVLATSSRWRRSTSSGSSTATSRPWWRETPIRHPHVTDVGSGSQPSRSEQAQAQLTAVGDAAHFLAHQLHVVDRATEELARQWYAAAHGRARACRKEAELEPPTADVPLVCLQAESASTEHNCQ